MLGCAEFCGYYDWTFEYLRRNFGEQVVADYWRRAIGQDSQRHVRELVLSKGLAGLYEHSSDVKKQEEAGLHQHRGKNFVRSDMFACPSLGFLLENDLHSYHDYCDHCMGWLQPILEEAGFVVHHEHNHAGQCYFETYPVGNDTGLSAPGEIAGQQDVRTLPNWQQPRHHLWIASRRVED